MLQDEAPINALTILQFNQNIKSLKNVTISYYVYQRIINMRKGFIICLGILFCVQVTSLCQHKDSITIKVNDIESKELLDLLRFENVNYYKMNVFGKDIKNKYMILTATEFWDGKSNAADTLIDLKKYQRKNGSDTLGIRVMAKKTYSDTVKFDFNLPMVTVIKKFKTKTRDHYSLRNITSGEKQTFSSVEPLNLLVYSLPYEDPAFPDYLQYCELSRDGTPPEKWGDKFGVKHYVVFKLHLVN